MARGSARIGWSAPARWSTEGKEFPDNSLIVGAPARVVRTLDEKALRMIANGADIYVRRSQHYAKGVKRIG